ncbi:RNA-dpendent RNA polymerase [Cardamom vein clearing nucleorhabdovirus 1]|uniref:RNA-directed RNA polymerase n=1 Tax=cardamom vein clearing virus TaxID=2849749 RepID=A0A6M6RE89_9RHAB|nr:RNA-dpendent RNA polymerase [Cardamom vein clearing nucleorhabdovirus 1]QJZ27984.1 RNA-dpendent RNA polymerase [Cardamom vein clearing nucleorhabdovirus 1]
MDHWENALEWDRFIDEHDSPDQEARHDPAIIAGSYHCKSALRSHESNIKLYLYRKSFNTLHSITGAPAYDDQSLMVISRLWRCFYDRSHGLDGIPSNYAALLHSEGSRSIQAWMHHVIIDVSNGKLLQDVLMSESGIWEHTPSFIKGFKDQFYNLLYDDISRVHQLLLFLNFSLVVLNFRRTESRPETDVLIPGICTRDENDVYELVYNDYIKLNIYDQCVRLKIPGYDQIMQKDIYLTITDKINERFNIIVGATLIRGIELHKSGNKDEEDILLCTLVKEIMAWGDSLITQHRNRAFDLIGKFEAYCVSAILTRDDPKIWNAHEFQTNLLDDDKTNQPDLYADALGLVEILNNASEAQLAEIHGLWRIWGHPIIDIEGGMKKMETTCLKQAIISEKETKIGERTFKLTFAKNYYEKHHHYPLTNISPANAYETYNERLMDRDKDEWEAGKQQYNKSKYVHRCIRENKKINERSSLYDHKEWDSIVFLQNFQVPQSLNLATMIKDKAISMTRPELVEAVVTRNSVFDSEKRRGVIKWLQEQAERIRDYLYNIDLNSLPLPDCIIGLYPKEREMKTKARFFSLMSYNMRMYITITEELLGKYLLPYFPMITMSDTLLSMIIRLYNMTTSIGEGKSKVTYSMNIDFSKWNQNMRERTNAAIFTHIDRILGFRSLISRTHSIFRSSYLYLCSGEYIPTIIHRMLTAESPYSRINDESGKEGLRQKGWTITTVCDILSLAFQHKVKIELIGGGDNQVLTVTIVSPAQDEKLDTLQQFINIQNRMRKFRDALAVKMNKRGLPLKLEETWISHRLLMYNKIMYINGVPMKGRLKVVSRIFSNANEGITSLGSLSSTLGTGLQSVSSKDYTPIFAWVLSRILILINIGSFFLYNPISGSKRLDLQIIRSQHNIASGLTALGSPLTSRPHKKTKTMTNFEPYHSLTIEDLFIICLYYHKILGGPSIGTPYSYIMKGFPDPLSEALTFNYNVISRSATASLKAKIMNITSVEASPTKHWEHLLEDPVSINHNAPAHGIAALRTQAEEIMKATPMKNRQFRELIDLGDNEYLKDLSTKLCTPPELEPRLLHDIVGSTIPGYVNTILSKVDQSSTLNKLAANRDVIAEVYESELKYYIYLASKIRMLKGYAMTNCPSEDSRSIRNASWGKHIIGVSTPHPAAFLSPVFHHSTSGECDHNYILVHVYKHHHPDAGLKRGPYRPYFGSYTEEKFKTSVLASAYGDEDILKRGIKIQKLLGWRYVEGSYMYKLIQGILKCVTNADPSKFLPNIDEITGDVEHRYHDMATKHGGIPSNLIQPYTHTSCNTSTFINHSKGAYNESLHFQATIIYSSMISYLLTDTKKEISKIFHFHEKCTTCIQKIEQPSSDDQLSDIELMSCPKNPLMYVVEEDIPIHYHSNQAYIKDQVRKKLKSDAIPSLLKDSNMEVRDSWLLLLLSYMIYTPESIKISTLKMQLEKLEIPELYITLMAYVMAVCQSLNKPYGLILVTDWRQCVELHYSTLRRIFSLQRMQDILADHAIPVVCCTGYDIMAETSFVLILRILQEKYRPLTSAYIKNQDPHFTHSHKLYSLMSNKGCESCTVCLEHSKSAVDTKVLMCSTHGEFIRNNRYHLFSLDKLSKMLPAYFLCDQGNVNAPPSNSIIKLFSQAQNARKEKEKMSRSQSLLLSGHIPEETLRCLISGWNSNRVSDNEVSAEDTLLPDVRFMPEISFTESLPLYVDRILGYAQCIWEILYKEVISKGKKDRPEVYMLGVEISYDLYQLTCCSKSILLVEDLLYTIGGVKIIITPMLPPPSQLEDFDHRTIMTAIQTTKMLLKGNSVTILDPGDEMLDTMSIIRKQDGIALLDKSLILPDKQFYVITRLCTVYEVCNYYSTSLSNRRYTLMVPQKTPCHNTIGMILISPAPTNERISGSALHCAIQDNIPQHMSAVLFDKYPALENLSCKLTFCIYNELVRIKSGITSEATMRVTCAQLLSGLRLSALLSHDNDPISWKGVTIIRMVLSIWILCDKDPKDALLYFSKYQNIAYKKGTYKTLVLYKGKAISAARGGYFINMTRRALGSGLVMALEEMRGWLSITWRESSIRTNIIVI